MAIEFTKQAEELLKAAREARIPDNVKALAEEGVATTRKAYDQLHSVTKEQAAHTDTVLSAVQAHGKTLADKVLANSTANAEATFNAALKIARASTIPEAAKLQAEFVQSQFAAATSQSQELFSLSAKAAASAFEQVQAVAGKFFGSLGKAN